MSDDREATPEEVEIMGLGALIAIMQRMTWQERLQAIDDLANKYGNRVLGLETNPTRVGGEEVAARLAPVITDSVLRGAKFGSWSLARLIADAGYRQVGPADGEAVELLKYALHLRQHGENAPGGSETWADFDRRAEAYLRARS